MENLIQTIHKIEYSYKSQLSNLKRLKLTLIIIGIGGVFYATLQVLENRNSFHLSKMEFMTVELGLIFIVLTPILLTPLYLFFSDRIYSTFKWEIKTAIFKTILDKYQIDFKISMENYLTDLDIKNLGFDKSLLRISYGDDLIFGSKNDINFRMAEMHSISLFHRYFDGLVGVLIFNNTDSCTSYLRNCSAYNDYEIKIIPIENKLYFLLKGDKSHFEFKFEGDKLNENKLISDYNYFDKFIRIMFGFVATRNQADSPVSKL